MMQPVHAARQAKMEGSEEADDARDGDMGPGGRSLKKPSSANACTLRSILAGGAAIRRATRTVIGVFLTM